MKYIGIILVVVLFGSSCSMLQYQYYNPKISTTDQYNTFVVLNKCEAYQKIISSNQQGQVKAAFSSTLLEKGLQTEKDQIADLVISFYVTTNYYEGED